MKVIFNDKINITIHLEEKKLREIDKLAKIFKISRNKLILSSIEYAIDNQGFLDSLFQIMLVSEKK